MRLKFLALSLICATAASVALAAPEFVNGLALPGNMLDASGGTTVNDGRVGYFSDIYYDPNRKEWWGLSDRGPGGGTLTYDTRVQRFDVDIDETTGAISNFKILQTVIFKDKSGNPMNGIAPSPTVLGSSFDPEGFVVHPDTGHFFVSDEYGPSLYEFDRDGNLLRNFTIPANLIPRNAGTGTPNFAGDTGNTAGKRTNRGFEGLAISPNGNHLYAMLQSAMLDEGGGNGRCNRIVKFNIGSGKASAQYAYQMEDSGQGRGISALVAVNDSEFLVLERNNRGVGVPDANLTPPNKKVFRIDITNAADFRNVTFPVDANGSVLACPAGKVSKSVPVLDLAANTLDALGGKVPEKWEGLAIGPMLDDGSYLMLAGTDNDYSVTQNGTGTQFDVYFNKTTGARIQCDIGTFNNCIVINGIVINANGSLGGPIATDGSGFALIPGVLHAYKASADDPSVSGYVVPAAKP
jgi:hypothetical protein